MALRALAGVASAWLVVFVSTWCLEQLAALRRPDLAGMVFAGVGSGIALSGALCLMLMQADASAAQAWIALGIAALALAALSWSAIGEHGEAPSLPAAAARPQAFRPDAQSLRLVFSYGAFGFGYIIPATFLPLMAKRVIEDPAVFGWSWPLFGAAAVVSTLLAAAVPAARSGRRLWIAAQLVMALGVALPVLWPGIMAIMLAALCVGGTFMVITMAGIQEAHRLAGTHARGLIAAMTSAFAVGQIAGPLWVSFASGRDGEFSSPLLAASLLLALGAGALMTRRQR
jgi:predicted MFS family arabinose efflux permease